ncbi:IS66 family transposase [Selenomonas ruminis]
MEIHWHSSFPCYTGQLGNPVSRRLAHAAGRLHARRAFEAYALNHRNGLSVFLQDGNIALSNNICERAIRNFTIGRKNWLFSALPKGAAASAAVYSIVETSKANGLEPFRYLTYLFENLPNINFKIHPELLENFLPWDEEVQQNCK